MNDKDGRRVTAWNMALVSNYFDIYKNALIAEDEELAADCFEKLEKIVATI